MAVNTTATGITFAPQNWMTEPEVTQVFDALRAAGAAPRFVGGCVRDALLGRRITDIDIAVDVAPQETRSALEKAGIRAVPTGLEHGTITAVLPIEMYEITSLRRDVETDGRRAVVSFTQDWREDSIRRDFTINALYLDQDGTVHDFHDGLADLRHLRLRFIGDADLRIREDVLRILRFFRFHAQLGITTLDSEGLAACLTRRDLLPQLSAERVRSELLRLLQAADPGPVIQVMIGDGFLSHWLPEAENVDALNRLVALEQMRGECDPIRRLSALCTATDSLAARLKLPNRDQQRLAALQRPLDCPATELAARQMIYRQGTETAQDSALTHLAREEAGWDLLLAQADSWTPPIFPLSGQDALSFGLAPGPEVGSLLRRVEDKWVEFGFREDRIELLQQLEEEVRHG